MVEEKLKIGIDIDEVLAKQLEMLSEFYFKLKGKKYVEEDFSTYYWPNVWGVSLEEAIYIDELFKKSSSFENLNPVEGSVLAIQKLKKYFDLIVITSRPIKFENKTIFWLNKFFPNSFKKIIHSSDFHSNHEVKKTKSEICNELGIKIMIEDNADYSLDCAKNGIKTFLISKPWNQNYEEHENIVKVKDWNEILERLK